VQAVARLRFGGAKYLLRGNIFVFIIYLKYFWAQENFEWHKINLGAVSPVATGLL